jgi:hypothetical protein
LIESDDAVRPHIGVDVFEIEHLRPGDKLPALSYQDKTGKVVDVGKLFAAKVGVLMIAAEACPVAFFGLAAMSRDLATHLSTNKVAAVAINPWHKPADSPEHSALSLAFPVLYSPLTTSDSHGWSEVLDVTLGQPSIAGPPMPIVYVVGSDGVITLARWGYQKATLLQAVDAALAKP